MKTTENPSAEEIELAKELFAEWHPHDKDGFNTEGIEEQEAWLRVARHVLERESKCRSGILEAGLIMAEAVAENTKLKLALQNLLSKLDAMKEPLNEVMAFYNTHGLIYRGENWKAEYDAAKELLK